MDTNEKKFFFNQNVIVKRLRVSSYVDIVYVLLVKYKIIYLITANNITVPLNANGYYNNIVLNLDGVEAPNILVSYLPIGLIINWVNASKFPFNAFVSNLVISGNSKLVIDVQLLNTLSYIVVHNGNYNDVILLHPLNTLSFSMIMF